jgi:hypothetical protein
MMSKKEQEEVLDECRKRCGIIPGESTSPPENTGMSEKA